MAALPSPDLWPRIAPLLEEALELPPERRGAFLDQACAGDPVLRAELDQLVSADSAAGAFLGAPIDLTALVAPLEGAPFASPDAPLEGASEAAGFVHPAGTSIGPYRIVREIGRGGMGVVYEAEQQRPRRPVALKVILGGRHADAEAVRLFQRETDSLARLKHPGIAAIYESGSTGEGQHFFAMELVPGRTLSDYLEKAGPPASGRDLRRRLALFRRIAAAVSYAHQRGVIHRDLKPSNILVLDTLAVPENRATGSQGDNEAPDIKVLDFGLARITDPEGTDPEARAATAVTEIGRIQGTLPYMSPEQIRGRRDEIDVRTDVYSLGVILYRMLAGRLPYDLDGVGFPEAVRIVCEQVPRPLRGVTSARLPINRDVMVIVLKALEKDPARRYQSVAAFDDDVARYLSGQPILARPPSATYQIRKLVARHKLAFAAAGAAVILLAGFAAVMTVQARRIAAERDRANRESATALRVSEFMTDLFKISDPSEARGNSVKAREILDKGVEKIGKALADEPEVLARLMQIMGKVYTNLGLYHQAEAILEQSLAIRRRVLGEEHADTLAAMSDMARIHTYMGRPAEAVEIYALLVEIRRRVLGEDHPETLGSMSGLAYAYRYQGRHKEAETLVRRVLEARRRILGDDHPDTIASMVSLANGYRMERRYSDAEAALLPAIERLRRVQGNDHPSTLENIGYLAIVYRSLGRYAEAEKLGREALDGLRRVEGEDHPVTLEAMHQLASIYGSAGRHAECESLLREVLQARRRVLGEDHFATLNSMNNLAYVLMLQKRYVDAELLLREAVEKMRRSQGESNPDTLNSMFNLGSLAALRGDRAEALDWLGQAVKNGWSHTDRFQEEELKSLRGDPGFEALVAQARKNADR